MSCDVKKAFYYMLQAQSGALMGSCLAQFRIPPEDLLLSDRVMHILMHWEGRDIGSRDVGVVSGSFQFALVAVLFGCFEV